MNRKQRRATAKASFNSPQTATPKASTIQVLFETAIRCHQAGQLAEAERLYRQILATDPQHADALNLLGAIAHQVGQNDAAIELIGRAIGINETFAPYHYNLGKALTPLNRFDEAVAAYNTAIHLKPDDAEAHNNLGVVLKMLERFDEAVTACSTAIRHKPDYAEAHNNLGAMLEKLERFDEAVVACKTAIDLKPDFSEAFNNLGVALGKLDRLDEAITALRSAISLKPEYSDASVNLGVVLGRLNRFEEAIAVCNAGINLKPDFAELHWNLSLVLLRTGLLGEGWDEYEWRWLIKDKLMQKRPYPQPMWSGDASTAGPILLWPEQGLGDSIQFVRYAPLIAQSGRKVILEAPAALKRLFETIPGITVVSEGDPVPDFSVHSPLLSLPRACKTTLATIPGNIPYLHAPPDVVTYWREQLANRPGIKIGVTWRGSKNHTRDRMRSMTPAWFSRFLDVPGLSVVSLEKDGLDEECNALGPQLSVLNAGPQLGDMADTAGLIANLDLVISVDTSVCHLAGALGVPTWTLVDFGSDWRWLTDRDDSPWYPTMRLFRQPSQGDWTTVVERVRVELCSFVAEHALCRALVAPCPS